MALIKTQRIRVRGIVQGVGFRPFIYKLARDFNLKGSVHNDTEGVLILAEGHKKDLVSFTSRISADAPPLARIDQIVVSDIPGRGYKNFSVVESQTTSQRSAFIPPDTMVCEDCLKEYQDPADRRAYYPFITCTNCGPRFSIIKDIPYDRKNTAMDVFPLCRRCRIEYEDPLNRRFHTEPNACPECGPHLKLLDRHEQLISENIKEVIHTTVSFLKAGKILAIKGVGGYHLAVDAASDAAVEELRKRKHRPFKPFALMAGSLSRIKEFLSVSEMEEKALTARERPVVLLKVKKQRVSPKVAPHLTYLGIMLPYTPFQHSLFKEDPDLILVMTSANLSDEPIIFSEEDIFSKMGGVADYFVTYNRKIQIPSDDSVQYVVNEKAFFIRRSKGYVPVPIFSQPASHQILATGADLKNSFALARKNFLIVSQYTGDLQSPLTEAVYNHSLAHLKKIFDFEPTVIVSDMHPAYYSSRIADAFERRGLTRIKVQHHHAHIASVLEENGCRDKVIGLAFDGTGYGTDGKIWGSEFLIADKKEFLRAGHFSYFPLPGSEKAISQVWRIGLAMVYQSFGRDLFENSSDRTQRKQIIHMIDHKIYSPLTCSIGRIFDGVSNLLGIRDTISTEAEAAQLLEETAMRAESGTGFEIDCREDENGVFIIDTNSLTRRIVQMIQAKEKSENIAYAFHLSIVKTSVALAEKLSRKFKLSQVALSGGVFQNRLLLGLFLAEFKRRNLPVLLPREMPFNDGCIAHGQLAVAKEMINPKYSRDENF